MKSEKTKCRIESEKKYYKEYPGAFIGMIISELVFVCAAIALIFVPMLAKKSHSLHWGSWSFTYVWGNTFYIVAIIAFVVGFAAFLPAYNLYSKKMKEYMEEYEKNGKVSSCSSCGATLTPRDKYCSKCGTSVEKTKDM